MTEVAELSLQLLTGKRKSLTSLPFGYSISFLSLFTQKWIERVIFVLQSNWFILFLSPYKKNLFGS